MSSDFSKAIESVGSSADTDADVKAIIETNFQLNGIASALANPERVKQVSNKNAGSLRGHQAVSKVGQRGKSSSETKVIPEQDLIEREGEDEE